MTLRLNYGLPALILLLSACSIQPQARHPSQNEQLEFSLGSGTYICEHGQRIRVVREAYEQTKQQVRIVWNGNNYKLERDKSYSGLPRFEDASTGLVWIDMPQKSLLLDGKANRPLANECKLI